MYCPKCGQEQFSDNVRFCSRCGFQLDGVTQLLVNDGVLPIAGNESPEKLSLYRQITSRMGAKAIFISLVLLPFAILLGAGVDSPGPLLLPFVIFVLGLAQILYVQIFGKKVVSEKQKTQENYLNSNEARFNLPPAQNTNIPIIDIKQRNTSKINQPPSVTEPTTNLLELKEK